MKSDKFHAILGAAVKSIKPLVSFTIIILSIYLCRDIVVRSIANQIHKNDYAELNHIKYGLFNIDEWKGQIAVILAEEINKLDLLEINQQALRKHVEAVLISLIDEIDRKIREGHSASATGRIKQSFIDAFISVEDIKNGVPAYADIVIKDEENDDKEPAKGCSDQ